MTHAEIEAYRAAGTITDLQAEVLQYRRRGLSRRAIAHGLGKAPATIRDHEHAALRRIANATTLKETAA